MKRDLGTFVKVVVIMMLASVCRLNGNAQNLIAAQYNIYFGKPKTLVSTSQQGSITVQFDPSGRITSINQGNMKAEYEWSEDGKRVTLSMYQGINFQDSGEIEVKEISAEKLEYLVGGMLTNSVYFKPNKAIDKIEMSNPQMSGSTHYYYKNEEDVYPYAIEQRQGEQSMVVSIEVYNLDSMGNATDFSQEFMGTKMSTHYDITYY